MEDTLSDKLTFEVDPISGKRVVKALNKEEDVLIVDDFSTYPGRDARLAPRPEIRTNQNRRGFFMAAKQPMRPPRPIFPPWRPPSPPAPPPRPNPAVRLSREIYQNLDVLIRVYRDLQRYDGADVEEIRALENQTLIMRATMGNIYRTLSGNTLLPPSIDSLNLDENYCVALSQTRDLVDEISNDMLNLMRLVSISSVDRQLLILNATLSSNERTLERLRADCVARGG